jgi:hypothetical protein
LDCHKIEQASDCFNWLANLFRSGYSHQAVLSAMHWHPSSCPMGMACRCSAHVDDRNARLVSNGLHGVITRDGCLCQMQRGWTPTREPSYCAPGVCRHMEGLLPFPVPFQTPLTCNHICMTHTYVVVSMQKRPCTNCKPRMINDMHMTPSLCAAHMHVDHWQCRSHMCIWLHVERPCAGCQEYARSSGVGDVTASHPNTQAVVTACCKRQACDSALGAALCL